MHLSNIAGLCVGPFTRASRTCQSRLLKLSQHPPQAAEMISMKPWLSTSSSQLPRCTPRTTEPGKAFGSHRWTVCSWHFAAIRVWHPRVRTQGRKGRFYSQVCYRNLNHVVFQFQKSGVNDACASSNLRRFSTPQSQTTVQQSGNPRLLMQSYAGEAVGLFCHYLKSS